MRMLSMHDPSVSGLQRLVQGINCAVMIHNENVCTRFWGIVNRNRGGGRVFENCFSNLDISGKVSSTGSMSWELIGPNR